MSSGYHSVRFSPVPGTISEEEFDMRLILTAALVSTILASPAFAEDVEAPKLKANDSWTYAETTEGPRGWHQSHVNITVVRTTKAGTLISFKEVGSPAPPSERLVGSDWSRARSVNGKEQVYNKRFDFPMREGKSWGIDYTENDPNRLIKSTHIHLDYSVSGWEEVTVPAGTFRAMKIEADGQWTGTSAPALVASARTDAGGTVMQTGNVAERTVTGRLYKAYWYVPAVKRYVKAIEESYDGNGTLTQRPPILSAPLLNFETAKAEWKSKDQNGDNETGDKPVVTGCLRPPLEAVSVPPRGKLREPVPNVRRPLRRTAAKGTHGTATESNSSAGSGG
jgi:hypothetical protein